MERERPDCVQSLLERIARERTDREPPGDEHFINSEWALMCLQNRTETVLRLLDLHSEALSLLLRQEQRNKARVNGWEPDSWRGGR